MILLYEHRHEPAAVTVRLAPEQRATYVAAIAQTEVVFALEGMAPGEQDKSHRRGHPRRPGVARAGARGTARLRDRWGACRQFTDRMSMAGLASCAPCHRLSTPRTAWCPCSRTRTALMLLAETNRKDGRLHWRDRLEHRAEERAAWFRSTWRPTAFTQLPRGQRPQLADLQKQLAREQGSNWAGQRSRARRRIHARVRQAFVAARRG